jgi:hypothetical protein
MNAVERKAREILAANGEPNPHPALLEDTMREVEYHGLVTEAPAEEKAEPQADVWTVEKNEYGVPCEHPLCEQLHQRFMTVDHWEGLVEAGGVMVWSSGTSRFHNRTVVEWVVLHNGERATEPGLDEVFETKREAVAVLKQRGLL